MKASRRSCAHCGRELRQEARFCPDCGHSTADDRQQGGSTGREGASAGPPPATMPIEKPDPSGADRVGPSRGRQAWPTGGGYEPAGHSGATGRRYPAPDRYPAGDVPPAEPGPPFNADPAHDPASWPADGRRRRWRPLALGLVVLILAGVAGALLVHRSSHTGQAAAAAHSTGAGGSPAKAAASAGGSRPRLRPQPARRLPCLRGSRRRRPWPRSWPRASPTAALSRARSAMSASAGPTSARTPRRLTTRPRHARTW